MDLGDLGRMLLIGAIVLAVTGLVLLGANAIGLGRLPGDFELRRGNTRVYAPIATSIVLSIVATVVLNVLFRR